MATLSVTLTEAGTQIEVSERRINHATAPAAERRRGIACDTPAIANVLLMRSVLRTQKRIQAPPSRNSQLPNRNEPSDRTAHMKGTVRNASFVRSHAQSTRLEDLT